ncbi:Panacea domain-containing protein [Burkholderia multivorans]|uniref:Panacea domain-containing protein n=1 Tax=Burkholderia multivorans TaxID=87883 RepID=UPI0021BF84E6|nr:type II toxin-antitoxin system antitoxin SocA domain-containing protein [Burkholderia multivorans]
MSTNALSVARYILERRKEAGDAITPMQLIKLVYIAQGYMLGRYGRPLFDEQVEAWQYGPVVPSVYRAVKQFKSAPVERVAGADDHDFSAAEREVLDFVANTYGPQDGVVLSSATHRPGTPWHQTWYRFGRNAPISNDIIENFYTNLLKQPRHSAL